MVNNVENAISESNDIGTSMLNTQPPNTENNEETDSEVVISTEEPNIIYTHSSTPPTTRINNGMETIKLPKLEDQVTVEDEPIKDSEAVRKVYKGKPFFHKKAGTIIQLFPTHYKHFVKKGE